jgi:hypothetical protein
MISSTIHAAVTARTASHLKIRNAENSIANGASVMATSMLVRKSSLGERQPLWHVLSAKVTPRAEGPAPGDAAQATDEKRFYLRAIRHR